MKDCEHEDFKAHVAVHRLQDSGGFNADVHINCAVCGLPFQFVGLPLGVDLNGATMSADGQEARLAIWPVGKVLHPLEGAVRFTIHTGPGEN